MAAAQTERGSDASDDSAAAPPVRARIRARLGIDVRAIAAFRIGLGLVALFDLLVFRIPGLVTFYTDQGIFPRSALAEAYPTFARWSLHALSGSVWAQALLLGAMALVAGCVFVGYRSRIATVVLALLLASMHARNPYLVNGGDTVLISLLLLGAFLPLDARWSIRPRGSTGADRLFSTATAVLLAHVVVIYAINALLKFQSDAWMSGAAVRRILQLEDFVYLLGPALSTHPTVLTAVNWLWVATLTASVGLALFTGRVRIAVVAAYVAAHLGMAATMRLGTFPFVMCVAVVPFLPPRVWERIDRFVADRRVSSRLNSVARKAAADSATARSGLAVSPVVRRGVRLTTAVVLVGALVSVIGWQLVTADVVETPSADDGALDRGSWAFFAPDPPTSYSWYVVAAERPSGRSIDLVDGDPVTFDRPPNAMDRYPSTLWKRYGSKGSGEAVAEAATVYACERAPADVESVTVYRVDQSVDADGRVGDPTPVELAARACA